MDETDSEWSSEMPRTSANKRTKQDEYPFNPHEQIFQTFPKMTTVGKSENCFVNESSMQTWTADMMIWRNVLSIGESLSLGKFGHIFGPTKAKDWRKGWIWWPLIAGQKELFFVVTETRSHRDIKDPSIPTRFMHGPRAWAMHESSGNKRPWQLSVRSEFVNKLNIYYNVENIDSANS